MKNRLPFLLLSFVGLLAALAMLSCDSANPVAPTGTTLTVTANPTLISLNSTSSITVTGFRPDGNPLSSGTLINISTTLGTLDDSTLEIQNGRASTVLRPDGRIGTATVTASLVTSSGGGSTGGSGTGTGTGTGSGTGSGSSGSGSSSAAVDVQIGQPSDSFPTLTLTVTPNLLNLDEKANVLVQAWQPDGTSYGAGGRIRLTTDLGSLRDEELVTDADGEATTVFRAGMDPGTATITGTIGVSGGSSGGEGGTAQPATVIVTIENQKPTLIISANPSVVSVLETTEITIIARDNNDLPLGANHRIRLTANLGTLDKDVVFTDRNGEASALFEAGERAGTGSVTAVLGSSDPATVSIDIQDSAASFNFSVDTSTVPSGGGMVTMSATVVNSDGQALSGVLVRFGASIGVTFSPAQSVTTAASGEATTTATFTDANLPPSGQTFTVSATVRIGGEDSTQTRTITVQ